jgi:hypothetical protein
MRIEMSPKGMEQLSEPPKPTSIIDVEIEHPERRGSELITVKTTSLILMVHVLTRKRRLIIGFISAVNDRALRWVNLTPTEWVPLLPVAQLV